MTVLLHVPPYLIQTPKVPFGIKRRQCCAMWSITKVVQTFCVMIKCVGNFLCQPEFLMGERYTCQLPIAQGAESVTCRGTGQNSNV